MPEETFKLVDEKHVSAEVEMMLWSPKMDLIALANNHGEVMLHRLSWQKVWILPPPKEAEDVTVGGLAWRPDGKILAVGYVSGRLRLCDIEKGEVLHSIDVVGGITSMSWIAQHFPSDSPFTKEPYGDDTSTQYLPKLQSLHRNYSEGSVSKDHYEELVEDSKRLKDQKELNFLVIGTNKDLVHVLAFGIFHVASVAFSIEDGSQVRRVCSSLITEDFRSLSIVVESTSDESDEIDYYILTFDTTLLMSRWKEVRVLALKYGIVSSLVEHLQVTVQQMEEAWEDILTEMDSKLLKFAEEKKKSGQGTVSNDFLELLLFGTPSPELQNFLLHELTEKGLKKLGYSIETSYSNIQKLVVKHLQTGCQALVYHLSELQGMSQWYDKFGVLGLEPATMQAAIQAAGALMVGACDLQQVIDGSIKNFKAFFRWLYVVILRLSKEDIPAELSKMTQHDINFVSEFLRDNFSHFIPEESSLLEDSGEINVVDVTDDSSGEKKPRFKLEKVGQYLKKEDLPLPSNITKNPWVKCVHSSPALRQSSLLYPMHTTKSLLQLQEMMEQAIHKTLQGPMEVINQSIQCSVIHHLFTLNAAATVPDHCHPPKVCQFTDCTNHQIVTVFTSSFLPCASFYILRQPTDLSQVEEEDTLACITCTSASQNLDASTSSGALSAHFLLDFCVYDQTTLSLLLVDDSEDKRSCLVQLPLSSIPPSAYATVNTTENIVGIPAVQPVDIGTLLPANALQPLSHMKAHSLAVSGSRKTATVLFHSRRRVRIFLMDADDDEDDDEVGDESASMAQGDLSESNVGGEGGTTHSESMMAGEEGEGADENKENASTSNDGNADDM